MASKGRLGALDYDMAAVPVTIGSDWASKRATRFNGRVNEVCSTAVPCRRPRFSTLRMRDPPERALRDRTSTRHPSCHSRSGGPMRKRSRSFGGRRR